MPQETYVAEIQASALVNGEERERTITVGTQGTEAVIGIRTEEVQKQHVVAILTDSGLHELIHALQRVREAANTQ